MIRAAIFDIYGTLLDSAAGDLPPATARLPDPGIAHEGDLLEKLRAAILARHAASPLPYPEVDVLEIWAGLLPALPAGRLADYALAAEEAMNPVRPMPGATATLTALAARGLPLGLLSNAQRSTLPVLRRHLGDRCAELFDPALCRYSWREGRAKPDPLLFEGLRAALAARGIAAGETLYVGNDVAKDIAPARACGFRTVLHVGSPALRWRGTTRGTCGADWLIGDLRELLMMPPQQQWPELRYAP